MLTNYIKVALRSFRKQKLYSFVNVAGLAIGIAGCLLVGLFVRSELSFDRFHANADRLYRAWVVEDYGPNEVFTNTTTPIILAPTLEASFPEVEATVRIQPVSGTIRRGAKMLNETIVYADEEFFEVFSFPLLHGDPATVMARRDGVVLTEATARRHLGGVDVLGQPLTLQVGDAEIPVVITGVAEDPPETSSVRFGLIAPFGQADILRNERAMQSWTSVSPETYVLLREGTTGAALEAKLPAMMETALGPNFEGQYEVHLQPMRSIHLDRSLPLGIAPVSDPRYATILGLIALVLLLIACINFTTLALSRSLERTREVGVRKALGAGRSQLMRQFWGEALLMTGFAMGLGYVLAIALLPLFNTLAGRSLSLRLDATLVLFMLLLAIVVGLVAGGYPALVLSRFRPSEVLRGRIRLGSSGGVQRGLVALQFTCSIALLGSTFVMSHQLDYLQTTNLGYEPGRLVMVRDIVPFQEGFTRLESIQAALDGESAVAGVTASAFTFGGNEWAELGYTDEQERYRTFYANVVAPNFLDELQIPLVDGEPFAAEPARAAQQVVVNEAFAEAYGLGGQLGQPLPKPFEAYELAGVAADFHFTSLHESVEPVMLVVDRAPLFAAIENADFQANPSFDLQIRLAPGPLPAAMAAIERAWVDAVPGQPFEFVFLDDELNAQYRAEDRLGQIASAASFLAVLIASLGLFSLAALMTAQRTKEIGVRKVLGASVEGIVGLLSKDFARLVMIGFVVATPILYFTMRAWLDGFAYRIDLGPGVFLLSGGLVLGVALLTVSIQALRAATADPIRALRAE